MNDTTEDQESPAPKVIDAPMRIWLTYGELEHDDTHAELASFGDNVCWCKDNQFESDVMYVRADEVDRRIADAVAGQRNDMPDRLDAMAKTLKVAVAPANLGAEHDRWNAMWDAAEKLEFVADALRRGGF